MTEADLKDIGIETFGARRRMQQAIKGGRSRRSFEETILVP